MSPVRDFLEAIRPGRVWEIAAVGMLAVWSWLVFFVTGDLWGLGGGIAFTIGALVLTRLTWGKQE